MWAPIDFIKWVVERSVEAPKALIGKKNEGGLQGGTEVEPRASLSHQGQGNNDINGIGLDASS